MRELTNQEDYELLKRVLNGEKITEEEEKNRECTKEIRLNMRYIKYKLDRRELLEQLAEEAAELAQAALKCIRVDKDSINPTSISYDEAYDKLWEEYNDVLLVGRMLELYKDDVINYLKLERWTKRLLELEEKHEISNIDNGFMKPDCSQIYYTNTTSGKITNTL